MSNLGFLCVWEFVGTYLSYTGPWEEGCTQYDPYMSLYLQDATSVEFGGLEKYLATLILTKIFHFFAI